jgi:16S rRNA (cytidine1402-2'-O)-methyltransferase
MCGREGAAGFAGGGVPAVVPGAGGASPSGFTTVVRASPVAGSICSGAGKVMLAGGSAARAGDATIASTRRIALKRDMEAGLYVVATPIGNLGDVTHRALQVLAGADVIAAEDTRVTRGLLSHFGIGAKLVALHAHNERAGAAKVIAWIGEGKRVAFVSDAGTPAVSDPGAALVGAVRAAGLPVFPIPGASALTTALSAAGIEADGVVFAGFLPSKGGERRERLAQLAAGPWAIALFEAPHRVAQTLGDLHAALGDRDVVVARELTKMFETITRVPLAQARAWVEADPDRRRGEFVLVVEGRPVESSPAMDPRKVLETLLAELPVKQAVALAVKLTGGKRNDLYALALELKR